MVSSAMHEEDMMTEEQLKVTGITDVNPFAKWFLFDFPHLCC